MVLKMAMYPFGFPLSTISGPDISRNGPPKLGEHKCHNSSFFVQSSAMRERNPAICFLRRDGLIL